MTHDHVCKTCGHCRLSPAEIRALRQLARLMAAGANFDHLVRLLEAEKQWSELTPDQYVGG